MIKILDFYADWCKPCKLLSPILDQIETAFEWVEIERIDIEDSEEDVVTHRIQSVPTLLFFKDNVLVDRVVGLTSKSNLLDIINKHS